MGAHVKLYLTAKAGSGVSYRPCVLVARVIARIRATRGFVVLNDRVAISRDHRISASDLGVTLLHESEMEPFAVGLASITPTDSAAASIEAWEAFLEIKSKYPNLAEYLEFSRSTYWMTRAQVINAESWLVSFAEYGRNLTRPSEHQAVLAMPSAYFFTHSRRWRSTCSYCFCVLLHEMSTPRRCWQCCMGTKIWRQPRRFDASQLVPKTMWSVSFRTCHASSIWSGRLCKAPLQALPAALMARG